jgi:hypothetical protein
MWYLILLVALSD